MVEAVNVGLEQLAEGLDCQFISHDGNFRHQDNTISETMFDEDGLHLSHYGTMKLMLNLGLKYQESTPSTNDQQRERPKPQNPPRDRGGVNQRKRQALYHHSRHSTQQSQPRRPLRVRASGPIQDSRRPLRVRASGPIQDSRRPLRVRASGPIQDSRRPLRVRASGPIQDSRRPLRVRASGPIQDSRRPLRVRDSGPIQYSQKRYTNVPSQQHTRRHKHWHRGAYNQNRFLNRQGPRQFTLQPKQQEAYDTRPHKLSQTSKPLSPRVMLLLW